MANGTSVSQIAFLIARTDVLHDGNYLRLANECLRRGHAVALCPVESLSMAGSRVLANSAPLTCELEAGVPFPALQPVRLDQFDVIWVLSLGMRHSFLDKMQLLYTLANRVRIVNSIETIMHFKSKYFTASNTDIYKHPLTWASNDPEALFAVMQREGGKWIVKPPASSFGRDVYLLTSEDPNARVILESMCGPESDNYCLLQRYVTEIDRGEKRVLIAGGKPVGQYLRLAAKDHRTNIEQGARVSCCELTHEEYEYCERIGAFLIKHGAEFVGIDLAFPWVIEFNVVNPGGLLTIEQVTDLDITPQIVDNVIDSEHARRGVPPGHP